LSRSRMKTTAFLFMRRDSWSGAQPPTWSASGFGIKVPVL